MNKSKVSIVRCSDYSTKAVQSSVEEAINLIGGIEKDLNNSSAYVRGDFGGYLKLGEDYYFSITALYGNQKVAGNAVQATYLGPSHQVKPELYTTDPLTVMKEKAQQLLGNDLGNILIKFTKAGNLRIPGFLFVCWPPTSVPVKK